MHDTNPQQRFHAAGMRVFQDLRSMGYPQEAQQLEQTLSELLPQTAISEMAGTGAAPPLPPSCPDCGATVRPDELEWINRTQAYCDYCGSVLEGK